jgi:hypothetical protein
MIERTRHGVGADHPVRKGRVGSISGAQELDRRRISSIPATHDLFACQIRRRRG